MPIATTHRPAITRTPKWPTFLPYSTIPVTPPPAVSLNLGSYMDLFTDPGTIHLFIPHRWQQVTCLRFPENLLPELPTAAVF